MLMGVNKKTHIMYMIDMGLAKRYMKDGTFDLIFIQANTFPTKTANN